MYRLVDREWGREINNALCADASELRIICPFIKRGALEHLLKHCPSKIQVITRFNLSDFAEGVSDIEALRELLKAGADIRGIKNLHAKLYLFGDSRAIITSANLTRAALERNHEFGLVASDESLIEACRDYFDDLWRRGGKSLSAKQIDEWDKKVTSDLNARGQVSKAGRLGDFGVDIGIPTLPVDLIKYTSPFKTPSAIADASQAFVKFFGGSSQESHRLDLSHSIIKAVKDGEYDRILGYPTGGNRPRQVHDGDVMFIAQMTKEPNDHRIFGWATAMRHRDGLDEATDEDIARRSWRKDYAVYIRVDQGGFGAEFLKGTMKDGVSLRELMDTLESDSFAPTQRNAAAGTGNTDPRWSIVRKPHIQLSKEGFAWLTERLQEAFAKHGKIPLVDIEKSI